MRYPRSKLIGFPSLAQKIITLSVSLNNFKHHAWKRSESGFTQHYFEVDDTLRDIREALRSLTGEKHIEGIYGMMKTLRDVSTSLTQLQLQVRNRPRRSMETLLASGAEVQASVKSLLPRLPDTLQLMSDLRKAMTNAELTIPALHALLSPQDPSRVDQSCILCSLIRYATLSRMPHPEKGVGILTSMLEMMRSHSKKLERGDTLVSDMLQLIPDSPERQVLLELMHTNINYRKSVASLMT